MQKIDKKRPYLYSNPNISFVTDPISGSSALVILYQGNAYCSLNGQNPLLSGKWPELSKMQVLEPDAKYYGSDVERSHAMAQSMLLRYVQCPKCNPRRKARKGKAAQ